MPGTLVSDSLAPQLADGSNITATANGTAVEVPYPGVVAVELVTGTCTGTSVTCDVEIQGCDASGFGSNVVSYGRFARLTEASDAVTKVLIAEVRHRYMRAVYTVAGTSPVLPITIKVRDQHYKQVTATRTA